MFSVSLCHAAQDAQFAAELSDYLGRNLPEAPHPVIAGLGRGFLEAADLALSADAAIVVLSSASVPAKWRRETWEPVLIDGPRERGSELLTILLDDCKYPQLLARRAFFDAREDRLGCFRKLKSHLFGIRSGARPRAGIPGAGEFVTGAKLDLEPLRRSLADAPGVSSTDDSEIARRFAAKLDAEFEFVLWVDCAQRSVASITGEIAARVGAPGATLDTAIGDRRGLIVLEDATAPVSEFPPLDFTSWLFVPAGRIRSTPHPELTHALETAIAEALNGGMNTVDEAALYRSIQWALTGSWSGAPEFGLAALAYFKFQGRSAEAREVLELLEACAVRTMNAKLANACGWERGWLSEHADFASRLPGPEPPGDDAQLAFAW